MTISLGARTSAIAVGTLATLVFSAMPAVAQSEVDLTPTHNFYTKQLEATGRLVGFNGQPNNANTLDGLFAYLAVSRTPEEVEAAQEAYRDFTVEFDSMAYPNNEIKAGTLSKIVALQAAFNDVDENDLSTLRSSVQSNGRVFDLDASGNPRSAVNNFGNAWSAIAFARAGDTASASKVFDYLLTQRCADGSWGWTPAPCNTGDTDTTSMVVMAAAAVQGSDSEYITSAVDYLRTKINDAGGIDGGWGASTNSTGLAASAFAIAGDKGSLDRSRQYLKSAIFGDDKPALAGAFAYQLSGVASATAVTNQILMATSQAALGYAGRSYADVSIPVAPETPTVTETVTQTETATVTETQPVPPQETVTVTAEPTETATVTETATEISEAPTTITTTVTEVEPGPTQTETVKETESAVVTTTEKETVTEVSTVTEPALPPETVTEVVGAHATETVVETVTEVVEPTVTVTATAEPVVTTVTASPAPTEDKSSSPSPWLLVMGALGVVASIFSALFFAVSNGVLTVPPFVRNVFSF